MDLHHGAVLKDWFGDLFQPVSEISKVVRVPEPASSSMEAVWGIFGLFIGFSTDGIAVFLCLSSVGR